MSTTKKQHYVPQVYLRAWTQDRWKQNPKYEQVEVFDLDERRSYRNNVANVCQERYLYEADTSQPDNEIEQWFHQFESPYGAAVSALHDAMAAGLKTPANSAQQIIQESAAAFLRDQSELVSAISAFAGVGYFRTPTARQLMKEELAAGGTREATAAMAGSMFDFVGQASSSTFLTRFSGLQLQLWVAPGGGFRTTDRPCFDLDTSMSGLRPAVGFDIGRSKSTIAVFPLSPNLMAIFYPQGIPLLGSKPVAGRIVDNATVQNFNSLAAQHAGRRLVSIVGDTFVDVPPAKMLK